MAHDVGRAKVVLWSGPQHSGKTTALARLVERARAEGHVVAGILAPSRWQEGQLVGFDVVDLASAKRAALATRDGDGQERIGCFAFDSAGLELGRVALGRSSTARADLVIIDEYGPLELEGGGWRRWVDGLVQRSSGVVLLVVRRDITETVAGLYGVPGEHIIEVSDSETAIDRALAILTED
ncbi:MAG: DUF2478 domain-containing protein [Phycisphaerae bacterium]|nr:DUF2478 domain-containing protein [Phycisphaerae bacterium]